MSDESELPKDDLPRIIVEDDKIIVLEDSLWEERNVESELSDDVGKIEESVVEDLNLSEEKLNVALEEMVDAEADSVPKDVDKKEAAESYKVDDSGEAYDSGKYNSEVSSSEKAVSVDYDGPVDLTDIRSSAEIEEERKGRSTLEIAGFFDAEAKKKRESKRVW
jgi:C-terminal processing protease CtpA/Prc